MVRKAQMELFVLLGLIFAGVVVVYFAYQGITYNQSAAPIGVSEEEALLRKPVDDLFRAAAEDALKTIEFQGGYSAYGSDFALGEDVPTAKFLGAGVRFWSWCQHAEEGTMIPSLNDEIIPVFERYIEKFITERLKNILDSSYRDVDVDLEDLDVNVDFSQNNMITKITIPITIEDYVLKPSYIINLPTKFREIYNFADDFSTDQATNRHIEKFTISSILFSPELPTEGMLTNCGDFIIETPFSISSGLREAAEYTMRSTFMWVTPPQRVANQRNKYYIQQVGGNTYSDLSPEFGLGDEFEFMTYSDPITIINNQWFSTSFPFIVPMCLTDYYIRYDVSYPYIVSVRDPLSGNLFNFAGYVYVDSNEDPLETGVENNGMIPGDCEALNIDFDASQESTCRCAEGAKYAQVFVRNTTGPIKDAEIAYGACGLAYKDDENGYAKYEGEIACSMDTDVIVSKEGYGFIQDHRLDPELPRSYTLNRIPKVNVYFYEVVINGVQPTECGIPGLDTGERRTVTCVKNLVTSDMIIGSLKEVGTDENWPMMPNMNSERSKTCFEEGSIQTLNDRITSCSSNQQCVEDAVNTFKTNLGNCIRNSGAITSTVVMDYVPGNKQYMFDVTSMSVNGFYTSGGFRSVYTLSENDHDLNIYIPKIPVDDLYQLTESQKNCLGTFIKQKCGIDTVKEVTT